MPFDEEYDQDEGPSKDKLKKVSSKKSIFDDVKKPPSQQDFEKSVKILL